MLVQIILKSVSPYVPVIHSAYGLGKTCIRVYSATSPSQALIQGAKGLVIDCTPPVIKYPLLCLGAVVCSGCTVFTGDPSFLIGALECCSAIVDS
jgi:hypothetical protein